MYIQFEDGTKHKGKNPEYSEDINAFDDAGYVLTIDDLVVDIDELPKPAIRKLLEIFQIETQIVWTDRGAHLYFKKPKTFNRSNNGICRLGFKVEFKTNKNTPNGLCIRRNGVTREIINEGMRQAFPSDLFKVSKKYQNMVGLEAGEGRNNRLYSHKRAIGNCDDWYKILDFINHHVFAEPLEQREFDVIARPEADGDKEASEEYAVALDMIKNEKCCNYGGTVWYWNANLKEYTGDDDELKTLICEYCPGKKTVFMEEVKKQILWRSPKHSISSVYDIKLENGFLSEGEFIEYPNYDVFTPFTIRVPYDPNAKPVQVIDDYLDQLTGKNNPDENGYSEQDYEDYRNVLLETLAFPLIVDHERTRQLARFFLFRGDGANGKGTLLQIIKKIYGAHNCSFLSIEELTKESYITNLIGKLVNLGDDIESKPINQSAFKVIKNITTADDITLRYLYQEGRHEQLTTKLIFTTNTDIKTFDKGAALKRRMYWMPMYNRVSKPDPMFITKLTTPEALRYWIKLLVEAYIRLYRDGWTQSKICSDYNNEYHLHNDLAEMFVLENGIDAFIGKTATDVKAMFNDWNAEDERNLSMKNFNRALWENFEAAFTNRWDKQAGKSARLIVLQKDVPNKSIKPNYN